MSLELTCKLKQFLQEQTGNGKNGPWVKQDFLVETLGDYPKTICMSAWGDQVPTVKGIVPGSTIKASVRIESREYNGRWYTDVRPWKIVSEGSPSAPVQNYSASPAPLEPVTADLNTPDDLPF